MLATERIRIVEESGGEVEESVAIEVMRKPCRLPAREPYTGEQKRDIKLRAILVLGGAGFTPREVAVAVGYTDRHLRNKRKGVEDLRGNARASGRV